MDAKHTQLLNDALEMVKLVLQSTEENGKQLEVTDNTLNGVGKSVTELNNIANEILKQEKDHNEILKDIAGQQETVKETNSALLETAQSITSVFSNNADTLDSIQQTISQGNEQNEQSKHEFIHEMSKKNESYSENVDKLFNELKNTKNTLSDLDTHDELAQLLEQVSSVSTAVKQLEAKREEQHNQMLSAFEKADENIKTSIESLDSLSTSASDLVSTFERAVSRIQTIEMKIDAQFDTALDEDHDTQNQDIEGE